MGEDQKLGQILMRTKLLSAKEVAQALLAQKEYELLNPGQKVKLGQVLLFLNLINMEELQNSLRAQIHKADDSRKMTMKALREQNDLKHAWKVITQSKRIKQKKENALVKGFKNLFRKS